MAPTQEGKAVPILKSTWPEMAQSSTLVLKTLLTTMPAILTFSLLPKYLGLACRFLLGSWTCLPTNIHIDNLWNFLVLLKYHFLKDAWPNYLLWAGLLNYFLFILGSKEGWVFFWEEETVFVMAHPSRIYQGQKRKQAELEEVGKPVCFH